MNCKALYDKKWFDVLDINFQTGYIIIKNNEENSLGLRLGRTKTVAFNRVDDVKLELTQN